MDIKKKLEERFGKERVEAWKKQFSPRQLGVIIVEDKIAVLRPIKAGEMAQFSMLGASDGIDKAAKYLIGELWIDGDNAILDDEECFMAAMQQVHNAIELKKSGYYRF